MTIWVYVVVPVGVVTEEILAQAAQPRLRVCRRSVDGSQVVLKYPPGQVPAALGSYPALSPGAVRAAMATAGWQGSEPA